MKKAPSQRLPHDKLNWLTTIGTSIDILFNTIKVVPAQLSLFLSLDSYPCMHEHSYVEGLFVHFDCGPQMLDSLHSSISTII